MVDSYDRIYKELLEEANWIPLPTRFERVLPLAKKVHDYFHEADWIEEFLTYQS